MCMYFDKKCYIDHDIYSWIVFKKKRIQIGKKRKTIRRHYKYKPIPGKLVEYSPILEGDKIIKGIFSYVSWCPVDDHSVEVWLCKIPKGTLVYFNSWEYTSERIEFINQLKNAI